MPSETVAIYDVADFEQQIRRGAELLSNGGVIVLPTETVYGAAAVINDPQAMERLKALRGREQADRAWTVHVASAAAAEQYLDTLSDLGKRMTRKLWPGPVGLIFSVPAEVRQRVAASLKVAESDLYDGETITLRCPDHIVASDVLEQVNGPVALTMAPTTASQAARSGNEIDPVYLEQVDLLLDAGTTRYAKPSTLVRVFDNRYEIVRAGVYDERIIDRLLQTTILFVCSGNTCRSPMAEALARRILSEQLNVPPDEVETKGINVMSAGSYAMPGSPATPQAVDAVKQLGADLSRHRSKPLSVELIHQADMIFTMGRSHAAAVAALVPSAAEKVTTLSPDGEIDDPIGSDLAVYNKLAGEMRSIIEQRLKERSLP